MYNGKGYISFMSDCIDIPGTEGQSVVSLIADPEAMSLIMAWSHTFVEFDDEIFFSAIILLHPGGGGSIASSKPINGTLIQILLTMPWLRISYAWYIHSQFEHACDLNLRHITLELL